MMEFSFQQSDLSELKSQTAVRDGELKLGQCFSDFESSESEFAILSISEDIGPQANHGNPGSKNNWTAFLRAFSNIQSTEIFTGKNIAVYGNIEQHIEFESIEQARNMVSKLDEIVENHVNIILKANKIPIVIGGGHNNAYPIIKAISKHKGKAISVVNLDAHADCRHLEGRHSGNPFSYAIEHKFLKKYTVLGLHENYNSQYIRDFLDEHKCSHTFFDAYIQKPKRFHKDLKNTIANNSEEIGLELDMDAVAFMYSSAISPSGFTVEQARKFVNYFSKKKQISYFHLPEAHVSDAHSEKIVGKTLAYLVSDFIKAQSKKRNK